MKSLFLILLIVLTAFGKSWHDPATPSVMYSEFSSNYTDTPLRVGHATTWATARGSATGSATNMATLDYLKNAVQASERLGVTDSIYRYQFRTEDSVNFSASTAWQFTTATQNGVDFRIDSVNFVCYGDSGTVVAGATGKAMFVPYYRLPATIGTGASTWFNDYITGGFAMTDNVAMDSVAIPTATTKTKLTFRSRSFTAKFDSLFHEDADSNMILGGALVTSYDYYNINPSDAINGMAEAFGLYMGDNAVDSLKPHFDIYWHEVAPSYTVKPNPLRLIFVTNGNDATDIGAYSSLTSYSDTPNSIADRIERQQLIQDLFPEWDSGGNTVSLSLPTTRNILGDDTSYGAWRIPIAGLFPEVDASPNWNNGNTAKDWDYDWIIPVVSKGINDLGLFDDGGPVYILFDVNMPIGTMRNNYPPWSSAAHTTGKADSSVELSMQVAIDRWGSSLYSSDVEFPGDDSFDDSMCVAGSWIITSQADTTSRLKWWGGTKNDSIGNASQTWNVRYPKLAPQYVRSSQWCGTTFSGQCLSMINSKKLLWSYNPATKTYSMQTVGAVVDNGDSSSGAFIWINQATAVDRLTRAYGLANILHDSLGNLRQRMCYDPGYIPTLPIACYLGPGSYNYQAGTGFAAPDFPQNYEDSLNFGAGGIANGAAVYIAESITVTSNRDANYRFQGASGAQSSLAKFADRGFACGYGHIEEDATSRWPSYGAFGVLQTTQRSLLTDLVGFYGQATYRGSRDFIMGNPIQTWTDWTYPDSLSYSFSPAGTSWTYATRTPYNTGIDSVVIYAVGVGGTSRTAHATYPYELYSGSVSGIGRLLDAAIVYVDSTELRDSTMFTALIPSGGGGAGSGVGGAGSGSLWKSDNKGTWRGR